MALLFWREKILKTLVRIVGVQSYNGHTVQENLRRDWTQPFGLLECGITTIFFTRQIIMETRSMSAPLEFSSNKGNILLDDRDRRGKVCPNYDYLMIS
jgi:hypothetical protein